MTMCNMTIEGGGRAGMVAPDDTTFEWVEGRTAAPDDFEAAVAGWRELHTDDGAPFDKEIDVDAGALSPLVSWGTNPGHGRRRSPTRSRAAGRRRRARAQVHGPRGRARRCRRSRSTACSSARARTPGSATCAPPPSVVKGRRVASNVDAMVVPGLRSRCACRPRARAFDEVFRAAGFDWRTAGCSMCLGMNPDILQPGERCASTSNRNFEGRQGRGGRTHLVSPQMAAAAAIEGHFVDIRDWS